MPKPKLTLKDFQNDWALYQHYLEMSEVMQALDSREPLPGATITELPDTDHQAQIMAALDELEESRKIVDPNSDEALELALKAFRLINKLLD